MKTPRNGVRNWRIDVSFDASVEFEPPGDEATPEVKRWAKRCGAIRVRSVAQPTVVVLVPFLKKAWRENRTYRAIVVRDARREIDKRRKL